MHVYCAVQRHDTSRRSHWFNLIGWFMRLTLYNKWNFCHSTETVTSIWMVNRNKAFDVTALFIHHPPHNEYCINRPKRIDQYNQQLWNIHFYSIQCIIQLAKIVTYHLGWSNNLKGSLSRRVYERVRTKYQGSVSWERYCHSILSRNYKVSFVNNTHERNDHTHAKSEALVTLNYSKADCYGRLISIIYRKGVGQPILTVSRLPRTWYYHATLNAQQSHDS